HRMSAPRPRTALFPYTTLFRSRRLVQGLVYIFIALAALGVAGAAYFGLTFTPIEAVVVAIAFGCLAIMLLERSLRPRSAARLERSAEHTSELQSREYVGCRPML